jgi:hypothetical protein
MWGASAPKAPPVHAPVSYSFLLVLLTPTSIHAAVFTGILNQNKVISSDIDKWG